MAETKRDVLLTTYLTKYIDPQSGKRIMANDPQRMKLAITAAEVGHPCVVFHDQLSDEFCEQYPQTDFVKVSNRTMLSCNDYRFELFLQWLTVSDLERFDIGNVWLVDLFDVEMMRNPNYLIEDDELWFGVHYKRTTSNKDFLASVSRVYGEMPEFLCEQPMLMAGTFGGRKESILKFLERLTLEINHVDSYNCNMPVVNWLAYKEFSESHKCVWPLVSKFKQEDDGSQCCFRHKPLHIK
jgi:hypothetical protein